VNKEKLKRWWDELNEMWQENLILNLLLSQEPAKNKTSAFLDGSYGLFYVMSYLLYNDENKLDDFAKLLKKKIGTIDSIDIIKIINLKSLVIQNIKDFSPLSKFDYLELIYLDSCNLNSLMKLDNIKKTKFYENSEYPTNEPSLYKDKAILQNKLNIVTNAHDFVLNYFDVEYSALSEPGGYPKSIDELCIIFPEYVEVYDYKVRHYKLKEHTNIVLNQFEFYFSNFLDKNQKDFFRFFLIIHDIGKPEATKQGDKSNQYKFSIDIVNSIWEKELYSQDDLIKVLILLDGDTIGEYFQSKKSIDKVVSKISKCAIKSKLNPQHLLRMFLIYYQCDVAAYTADAGGLKFLEHLFEYKNGEKVFDEEEGLIRFSPKYWKMYLELKKEIELCQ